ncbi:MAG: hypothetical protein RLZZ244_490, partial [Verrucomicrobiota bacterium]
MVRDWSAFRAGTAGEGREGFRLRRGVRSGRGGGGRGGGRNRARSGWGTS